MNEKTAAEIYAATLERKVYLNDEEGAAYTGMSITTFREWSKRVGARRKLGSGTRGKTTNVRAIIDKAILEGRQ